MRRTPRACSGLVRLLERQGVEPTVAGRARAPAQRRHPPAARRPVPALHAPRAAPRRLVLDHLVLRRRPSSDTPRCQRRAARRSRRWLGERPRCAARGVRARAHAFTLPAAQARALRQCRDDRSRVRPRAVQPSCATSRTTTTATGSRPTRTATRTTCSSRPSPSSRTSGCACREISPHLVADARRQGGSLFRIYRDTRFARDKSPYKTQAGIYFRHERSKEAYSPGLYLHLEPRNVFAGGGIWHADTKTAHADPRRRSPRTPTAGRRRRPASSSAEGESLKRVPPAFDKDHVHADDLRRKDFAAIAALHAEGGDDRGLPRPLRDRVPLVHAVDDASSAAPSACRTSRRCPGR